MRRENESTFLNNLEIANRGTVKIASSKLPGTKNATSHSEVLRALGKFDHSPDVDQKILEQYKTKVKFSDKPADVAKEFFNKHLNKTKSSRDSLSIVTAKALRQSGIFKSAGRDVYEDLETGDFWKISEDKKHVMRLFKETPEGISDRKASKAFDVVPLIDLAAQYTSKNLEPVSNIVYKNKDDAAKAILDYIPENKQEKFLEEVKKIATTQEELFEEVTKTANLEEEKIYDMLMGHTFEEWYKNEFEDHVSGEEKAKSKEEIIKDIKSMLR